MTRRAVRARFPLRCLVTTSARTLSARWRATIRRPRRLRAIATVRARRGRSEKRPRPSWRLARSSRTLPLQRATAVRGQRTRTRATPALSTDAARRAMRPRGGSSRAPSSSARSACARATKRRATRRGTLRPARASACCAKPSSAMSPRPHGGPLSREHASEPRAHRSQRGEQRALRAAAVDLLAHVGHQCPDLGPHEAGLRHPASDQRLRAPRVLAVGIDPARAGNGPAVVPAAPVLERHAQPAAAIRVRRQEQTPCAGVLALGPVAARLRARQRQGGAARAARSRRGGSRPAAARAARASRTCRSRPRWSRTRRASGSSTRSPSFCGERARAGRSCSS